MRSAGVRLRRTGDRREGGLAGVSLQFFGVDGEMSGADLAAGGRLIQIGLACHTRTDGAVADPPEVFSSLINPGDMVWDPRAAVVHGVSRDEVAAAPAAAEVDAACVAWLAGHGILAPRRAIAVGFNIAAFDLPHLAAVLPRTAALFSRRSVDLNAVCFTLEGASYQGTVPTWAGWRRMAMTYAQRTIAAEQTGGSAHDAGYDALLHVHAWRFLRAASHGEPLPMPNAVVDGLSRQVQVAAGRLLAAVGPQQAAALTGFTVTQVTGWSAGGRVRDPQVLDRLAAGLSAVAG